MKKIAIVGAGVLGKQIKHYILSFTNDMVCGWYDDTKQFGSLVDDVLVLGAIKNIFDPSPIWDELVIAIGYRHLSFKKKLLDKLQRHSIQLYQFIHPSATVDPTSRIREGTIIFPNVVIEQGAYVDSGGILNSGVIITHHVKVGSCCFLGPGVVICGFSEVKQCCFLGAGTVVVDNVCISNGIQTGAGTIVIDDLTQKGLYVGNPAKFKYG